MIKQAKKINIYSFFYSTIMLNLLLICFFSALKAENKKNILITGGCGFIGTHVARFIERSGYQALIIDNLNHSQKKESPYGRLLYGDIRDEPFLEAVFTKYPIDLVIHLAALKNVGMSVAEPLNYYDNNVLGTLTLLKVMFRHNVRLILFSSTAAVYQPSEQTVIDEEEPCQPLSPYGSSKLMIEKVLEDMSAADQLRYCIFRYFNVGGGDPEEELPFYADKEANLIPVVLRALKNEKPIDVFGTDYPTKDGTCIRDYIHVEDIALAHVLAVQKLLEGGASNCYNLGSGQGFSVLEVIAKAEEVTGKKAVLNFTKRRAGDAACVVASSKKAKEELGWVARYDKLSAIVGDCWKGMKKQP